MYLSEIFEHLTYGELSTLKIGGLKDSGAIAAADYPQVISFINLGMIDLYKKFLLQEKNVVLELFDHITEYELYYEHAQSNPDPIQDDITRYIADTGYEKPFEEDILQIHSAYDSNFEEIPLNDMNERSSIFTIGDDIVQVPYPGQGTFIDLIFHAYPTKIPLDTVTPETYKIRLPQQFIAALTAYVGFRAHISLPAGAASKATEHFSRYSGICNEIRILWTSNNPYLSNMKALDQG